MWLPTNLPQKENVIGMWSLEEGDDEIRRSSLDTKHFSSIYGDVLCVPGAVNNAIKVTSRGDYLKTVSNNYIGPGAGNEMTVSFKVKFMQPAILGDAEYVNQVPLSIGKFINMPSDSEINFINWYNDCSEWCWFIFAACWISGGGITIDEIYFHMNDGEDYSYRWLLTSFTRDIWYHFISRITSYGEEGCQIEFFISPDVETFDWAHAGTIIGGSNLLYPINCGLVPIYPPYVNDFATKVDELIIWDTALSDGEIDNLFSLNYKSMQCESVSGGGGAYII